MGEIAKNNRNYVQEYTKFYNEEYNPEHPLILDESQSFERIVNGNKIILHGKTENGKWAFFTFALIFFLVLIGEFIWMEFGVGLKNIFVVNPSSELLFFINFPGRYLNLQGT